MLCPSVRAQKPFYTTPFLLKVFFFHFHPGGEEKEPNLKLLWYQIGVYPNTPELPFSGKRREEASSCLPEVNTHTTRGGGGDRIN